LNRRDILLGSASLAVSIGLPGAAFAAIPTANETKSELQGNPMNYVTTRDGTQIFYKDWGDKSAQPIVFSHGWPLSSDDWDGQMLYFLQHGYRVVAHDRRGHGRSSQGSTGHDMDHYADDLAAVTEHLNLARAIHVGHSTGGGEVVRYIARHGSKRVAKAVLVSSVPPLMAKGARNPDGVPMEVLDGIRTAVATNRTQFFKDFSSPFYGYNRPGAKVSDGIRDHWWLQGMMGSVQAHYEGIKAFSETDFTDDLKKIDVPTLVMHGDDDQVVPLAISSERTAHLVKGATLKVYPGYPHGMCATNADVINPDLLAFFKA
jgi:non-heme chloroperoxidase